ETEQLAKVEAKDLKQLYPTGIFRINDTKVVLVEKGTSFLKVAGEHNLSLSKLFDFNDMPEEDIAAQDRLVFLQRKRKTGEKAFHVAEAGETAYDIAQSQGIRLESLIEYNGVAAHSPLKAGEKIYLQEKAPQRVEAPAQQLVYHQAVQPQETFITHTVQTKETAYSISKKYGVSVEDILQWNNLSSADLRIGQELRIKNNR
ncbi:MAG: LysM peptidoglycan-binding domain-containing protein, partial [Sphingobacteriales bacterium]